jgi:hypothetical protein
MFSTIVTNAAGITAIVAVIASFVTITKGLLEYSKQNLLKRFEKYQELSGNWFEDQNIRRIIELLDDDPGHELRTLPYPKKEAFLGFYEEIALMLESGLIKKKIA